MTRKTQEPFDPMVMMDEFARVAESLAGMKAQLVAKGFHEHVAEQLVLETLRQAGRS